LPDNVYWKYNFLKSKKKIFVFVAPPAATPSPFAISSLRYAPLRPANPLRPRATYFSTLTNQNHDKSFHYENAALADLYWPKQGV